MTQGDVDRFVQQRVAPALQENIVTFPIDFRLAAQKKKQLNTSSLVETTWEDNTARKAVSADGYGMVAYILHAIGLKGTSWLTSSLLAYAEVNPPHIGKSATSQSKVGLYADRPGEVRGEIRLVRTWFALGQEHKGEAVPSRDILSSGKMLAKSCELFKSLDLVSYRVNSLLKFVDPQFHANLTLLREAMERKHAVSKCMNAVDPLLYEGREILYNRISGLHFDTQDPKLAYAALLTAGQFQGGYVSIPLLKLRIRLEPGDMIFIRGRVLEHSIEEWEGGQRISVPHFTHTSMWRSCGLGHLVDF
ncbi:hypothetical protein M378DRAFT_17219 [Amanita muscaria Koide BX008]|uniref:Uncharacterized protein n=1 Tax=Amanita muscaria (strain Koide BX008) TaxID=946122 RepID=A0A0C2SQI1_AMAMK|nr:hypothetical protein M378DRAFT_17219 [Amanita muscaria Koide BX008]